MGGALTILGNANLLILYYSRKLFLHSRHGYAVHRFDNISDIPKLINVEIQYRRNLVGPKQQFGGLWTVCVKSLLKRGWAILYLNHVLKF